MKEAVAKHQHVPLEAWFLTGVASWDTTVVNLYPGVCAITFVASNRVATDKIKVLILFVLLF
jgi:hypothetical protein